MNGSSILFNELHEQKEYKMDKNTKIGVVFGINLAVDKMFKKIWDIMHSEIISQHDAIGTLSEDMDAINELMAEQRKYIEEIGEDAVSYPSIPTYPPTYPSIDPTKEFTCESNGGLDG